jgi:hypothetical protein
VEVYFPWRRKRALVYPIPPAPKTAVLVPWFRPGGLVRVFGAGWTEETGAFAPCAIAATPLQLAALIAAKTSPPTHPLIALTRAGDPRITDADRRELWAAFGVPVFEQIVGERGELLAAECEAHEGLHIESEKFPLNNEMMLDWSACGCGRKTPRLVCSANTAALQSTAGSAR